MENLVEWNETFCSSLSRSSFIASTFLDSLKRLQPPPTTTPSSIAACHVQSRKIDHKNGGKLTCYSHENEIDTLVAFRASSILNCLSFSSTCVCAPTYDLNSSC